MGLGAKLNFAFITVIMVMVLGHAGYSLFMDYKNSREEASKRVNAVIDKLFKRRDTNEFLQIAQNDQSFAAAIAKDPAILEAFNSKDRDAIGKSLKAYTEKTGLDAFVTITDGKGVVLYGSDAPAKFGYSIADKCDGVYHVAREGNWTGYAAFSPTDQVTVTSMAAIKNGANTVGIVAVSHPVGSQLLTGLVSKFKFLDEEPILKNVELAMFSNVTKKVEAFSNGLQGRDGGFLNQVNQGGLSAIKPNEFESGGRLWLPNGLNSDQKVTLAVILATTPLPNIWTKAIPYAIEVGVVAVVAVILSFIFSTAISGSVRQSMQFLIGRARDLAAQKQSLAPLDGLNEEFYELGELMDTAVTSMRSTISSLKTQLSKRSLETEEKSKQEDYSSEQLVHMNRQLSEKTRQLTELSKQVTFSAQQTVVLQQKLDAVLQISTEGYLMLDQYGNVLSANPVFLNWMGVKEGEIAGRLCFDLVKKPGEPKSDMVSQAFARHSGNPADLINQFYPEGVIYHRYQEKSVEVLAHLHPVVTDDQVIQGWIMVLRDKSLRSEVAQLRTEIVAMLSDSIRAPLISVESSWKTLLSNAAQTLHPSVGQALAQLHTHYEQLIGLVDSLLMMYGGIVPPPVIPREQVIVTRLVAECLEEVAVNAREHKLSLDYKTVTGLPNLNSDREALKRIILQLLEKLISITAPGGRVRVESLVKGQEMRLGVTSSGPALPQEEIEEMFVGFVEGKHDQASYGSRLSMYLARNNVERLGGKIWAESDSGRGTSIYLILAV